MNKRKANIRRGRVILFMIAGLMQGCKSLPESANRYDESLLPTQFEFTGQQEYQREWWLEFDDLQLTQLIETALSDNLNLKSVAVRLERFDAQIRRQSSSLFPDIGLEFVNRWRRGLSNGESTTSSPSLSLGVGWEMDIWGRNQYAVDSAQMNYYEAEQQFQLLALALTTEVSRTWYNYVEQYWQVENLISQISNSEKVQKVVDLGYATAQTSASAVLRQNQLIETLQSALSKAQYQKQVLRRRLNVLLGLVPTQVEYSNIPTLPELTAVPSAGIPAQVIVNRPNVKVAWFQYQSSRFAVAQADAARYPNIAIGANLNSKKNNWENLFELWSLDFVVDIDIPLFDAGRRQANLDIEKARLRELQIRYSEVVLQALADVDVAYLQEFSQTKILESLKVRREKAQQVLDIDIMRYSQGMTAYLNVLYAQEKLFDLERQVLVAKKNLIFRRIDLYQAIGDGVI